MEAELNIVALNKYYGDDWVVRDLALSVRKGELVSLLGPSGCGKTTTLRMIAGFVQPSSGEILVRGDDIVDFPVHRRGVGLVFQNYALFPHLSVFNNVAFGLRRRKVPRVEIQAKVYDMLEKVQLKEYADRLPGQLSGGQQQRVALARVLVLEPSLVLLDEPFSNLDALLREVMRAELRRIQQRLGFTALFVTHDQEEAMALSDRIAVMHKGRIVQLGSPDEIYHRPRSRFVAEFIGRANLFAGVVQATAGECVLKVASGHVLSGSVPDPNDGLKVGSDAIAVIRPERMSIAVDTSGTNPGANRWRGVVADMEYLGGTSLVMVTADGGEDMIVEVPTAGGETGRFSRGTRVVVTWDSDAVVFVPKEET